MHIECPAQPSGATATGEVSARPPAAIRALLGAYLRRQRSRLGAPKAITAAAHELARILYHLMRYGEAYVKQSEAEYAEEVRARLERQLRRRAKEMGYELVRVGPPADAPPAG